MKISNHAGYIQIGSTRISHPKTEQELKSSLAQAATTVRSEMDAEFNNDHRVRTVFINAAHQLLTRAYRESQGAN